MCGRQSPPEGRPQNSAGKAVDRSKRRNAHTRWYNTPSTTTLDPIDPTSKDTINLGRGYATHGWAEHPSASAAASAFTSHMCLHARCGGNRQPPEKDTQGCSARSRHVPVRLGAFVGMLACHNGHFKRWYFSMVLGYFKMDLHMPKKPCQNGGILTCRPGMSTCLGHSDMRKTISSWGHVYMPPRHANMP